MLTLKKVDLNVRDNFGEVFNFPLEGELLNTLCLERIDEDKTRLEGFVIYSEGKDWIEDLEQEERPTELFPENLVATFEEYNGVEYELNLGEIECEIKILKHSIQIILS